MHLLFCAPTDTYQPSATVVYSWYVREFYKLFIIFLVNTIHAFSFIKSICKIDRIWYAL